MKDKQQAFPTNTQAIPEINTQQVLQLAQNQKNRLASIRGQADQMVADGISDYANGMLQILSQLVQINQQQKNSIDQLEAELKESKIPKSLVKHEVADTEGVAKGK